mmetsp:Transcript_33911/g.66709  ORF Transcript_33911/g.66709 Transcript_33911/m.66709 type:complete len:353 (-) Transcript_33911:396-1454(-)
MHPEVAHGGPMALQRTPMGGQYSQDMPLLTGRPPRDEGPGMCGVGDCVGFDVDDEYAEDAQLSYVGNGRGKYMQETTYKFVGKGAGNFDDVGVPSIGSLPPVNSRCAWLSLCGFLSLLLLGPLLWWLLAAAAGWWRGYEGKHDCQAGYNSWQKSWSDNKKAWCCEKFSRGCTQRPYDCHAGLDNWHSGWSDGKKAWCCNTERIGCSVASTTSLPYDCNTGVDNWSHGWSVNKKVWCCMNARRGCPTAPPTSLPFDCNIAFNNRRAAWSEPKKQWCCVHARRGCPTTTPVRPTIHIPVPVPVPAPAAPVPVTSLPFDCNAGFINWVAGWSDAKKSWCCAHAYRGCANQVAAAR